MTYAVTTRRLSYQLGYREEDCFYVQPTGLTEALDAGTEGVYGLLSGELLDRAVCLHSCWQLLRIGNRN